MDLHARVAEVLRSPPSWATLDAAVVARGRALVERDPDRQHMLAWFDRPEIAAVLRGAISMPSEASAAAHGRPPSASGGPPS